MSSSKSQERASTVTRRFPPQKKKKGNNNKEAQKEALLSSITVPSHEPQITAETTGLKKGRPFPRSLGQEF